MIHKMKGKALGLKSDIKDDLKLPPHTPIIEEPGIPLKTPTDVVVNIPSA